MTTFKEGDRVKYLSHALVDEKFRNKIGIVIGKVDDPGTKATGVDRLNVSFESGLVPGVLASFFEISRNDPT